jgi:16S rRNA (guanine966-N2)-methyltransferase
MSLENRGAFNNGAILDLFAGSGALGLEGLSRGANFATLVDNNSQAIAAIKQNINALHISPQTVEVHRLDYLKFLKTAHRKYSLVLIDPPYAFATEAFTEILTLLVSCNLLENGSLVVTERSSKAPALTSNDFPKNYQILQNKVMGDSAVTILLA